MFRSPFMFLLSFQEASDITALWQSSLFNANMEVQRYMIESNRAIFMVSLQI